MRKKRKPVKQSKEPIPARPIDEVLRDLVKRIESMERRVFPSWDPEVPELEGGEIPKRIGRKPLLPLPEVLGRRDALIYWLEDSWPELSLAFQRARTTEELYLPLKKAKDLGSYAFQPPFYGDPKKYLDQLKAFLDSGRYFGNPRNVAGAMAGMPEMSWKRSFDLCCTYKSDVGLRPRAIRDYLRRNFPQRLRELLKAETAMEAEHILRRSRTKDPLYRGLIQQSKHLLQWLRDGVPKS